MTSIQCNDEISNLAQPAAREEQTPVKRMTCFIPMDASDRKIGAMIGNLSRIRKDAGGGCFIRFFDEQKNLLADFLADHSEMGELPSQGSGWYIWSFRKDSSLKAKSLLTSLYEELNVTKREAILLE